MHHVTETHTDFAQLELFERVSDCGPLISSFQRIVTNVGCEMLVMLAMVVK